eukprot:m.354014 g.354014  ORF g.354014 m.354014 type:complete len:70 (-) comp16896_c0_seq1:2174-2383(-)
MMWFGSVAAMLDSFVNLTTPCSTAVIATTCFSFESNQKPHLTLFSLQNMAVYSQTRRIVKQRWMPGQRN